MELSPNRDWKSAGGTDRAGRADVLVVDDHPAIRVAVRIVIDHTLDLNVCGEAASAVETLHILEKRIPDVLILDISLEDTHGLNLLKTIHTLHPELPVVLYTGHPARVYAEQAYRMGASGFVDKSWAVTELLDAVRTARRGDVYVNPLVSEHVSRSDRKGIDIIPEYSVERLTRRERQVFQLIVEGRPIKEMEDLLGMNRKTIEAHRRRIRDKLGFETLSELIRFAARWAAMQN